MARFSTHVLDTSLGAPAAGVAIDLYRGGSRLKTVTTNEDGRVPSEELGTGIYELVFHAGDYFRAQDIALPDPPFLDEVVIRFGISDAAGKYHVPLLLSPYGYSTYRGS